MAHIVLAAMPFAGHVYPLVGVGRALVDRGHRVTFYTGSKYREIVESCGLTWFGFERATDFDDTRPEAAFPAMRAGNGPRAMLSSFQEIFFGTVQGQVQDLLNLQRRDPFQMMVAEGTCVGPSLAQEVHSRDSGTRIGYVTMAQAPLGLGLNRATRLVLKTVVDPAFRRLHNHVRAQVGLAPTTRGGLEGTWSRDLVIAQGTRDLERPAGPVPEQVRFIGDGAAGTRSGVGTPEWMEGLPKDRPLIHVSQGTLDRDAFPLVERMIEAVEGSDWHLVVGGSVPEVTVPDNVTVAPWVPQDLLLPRCSAFVSNGGYGGVLAALGHATPVLVVPGAQDKPLVARSVAASGAGISVSRRRASPATLRGRVEALIGDPAIRAAAERVSRGMAAAGGPVEAARLIESWLPGSPQTSANR